MKIFGIEIERKTDILAAAAFLMSLLGIAGQVALFLRGPDIQLFTPDQILLFGIENPDGKIYTRVSSKMVYRNAGSPGYHDTIKKEYVTFKIGDIEYKLLWDEFIDSYPDKENKKKLIPERKSEAVPVQVNAGMVQTHETLFAPWVLKEKEGMKSFLEWDDFKKLIAKQKKVYFRFTFETFSGKVDYVSCHVVVKEFLSNLDKGWSAPVTY